MSDQRLVEYNYRIEVESEFGNPLQVKRVIPEKDEIIMGLLEIREAGKEGWTNKGDNFYIVCEKLLNRSKTGKILLEATRDYKLRHISSRETVITKETELVLKQDWTTPYVYINKGDYGTVEYWSFKLNKDYRKLVDDVTNGVLDQWFEVREK
jgi:hypothetical protein